MHFNQSGPFVRAPTSIIKATCSAPSPLYMALGLPPSFHCVISCGPLFPLSQLGQQGLQANWRVHSEINQTTSIASLLKDVDNSFDMCVNVSQSVCLSFLGATYPSLGCTANPVCVQIVLCYCLHHPPPPFEGILQFLVINFFINQSA